MTTPNESPAAPLYLAELVAENIKRIRLVRFRPRAHVNLIGGRNEQGKSSLIDAVAMLLGGKGEFDEEPLRRGARRGRIEGNFGEFTAERTFTAKGATALTIKGADGNEIERPQSFLDEQIAKHTFDPTAIFRVDPAKQDEVLREAFGLDFSDLEAKDEAERERRKLAKAEVKRLETLVDARPYHADAPDKLVDVAEVTAELTRRNEHNAKRSQAVSRIESEKRALSSKDEGIARLRRKLAELEMEIKDAESDRAELAKTIETLDAAVPEALSIDAQKTELATAEATNEKVRSNGERRRLEAGLMAAQETADAADEEIHRIAQAKLDRLAEAKFSVPKLTFTATGWRYEDVPLSQASQAQKIRLGVAFGVAMNPRIKIMLVREGSLLDDDMLALLAALAEQNDCQVFVERVGTRDPGAIIIEDGEIAGASSEAAAE